jgi:NAD(P)H-flavin reductase/hemoglobin-like flavoprotein
MPGRRHLPGAQEASGNGEPMSRHGLLAWWQRRSRRMDLEVLARVRDGLKRLDAEPGGGPVAPPPSGTAGVPASAPTLADTRAGAETAALAGAPVQATAAPADLLPDAAIASIRETFAIVAAAGEQPASYFYGRLFVGHPHLRGMFPPAMDVQRDRLLRALIQIVEGLTSPEDLVRYLSQLGRDHRKYSVEPAMYDAVGEALIATLRAYAGPAFTQDAQEAWVQAYQAASGLMIRAAEDDSAVAPAFWTAELVENEQRQPGIAVLTVAPDQPLPYLAGQHVTVQTPRWPRVWRPYSVASRPREDGLMTFHVRAVPGGWVSNALVRYSAPGDELILGPALGTMTLGLAEQRDLLCVVGGTGLAPIKAIIEQAIRESSACPREIFLFYGARTRDELYDLPDLYRLADAYPRFLLTPVTSDDPAFDGMQGNVGRVAARYLPHRECEAYVAGPVAMVHETIRVLARAGIPQQRIHYDDALLAEDKRASVPRPRGESGEAGEAGNPGAQDASPPVPGARDADPQVPGARNPGAQDAAAETAHQEGNARDGGPGPERQPATRDQVPTGALNGRRDMPPS